MQIIERFATKCPCWGVNKRQQGLSPGEQGANSNYQEFYRRFADGDIYLILHSLGCARASADYQSERWNVATNNNAIAHAVIDSEDGIARQNLEWGMRGWHCGNPGNNCSIGIEMCESDAIAYDREKSWLFSVKNAEKAKRHCRTTYNGAVELFAYLCTEFRLDPMTRILSHKEAHAKGIASNHGDPEHYWAGLGTGYTMDGFRAAVAAKMAEKPQAGETNNGGFLGFPDVNADDWFANALEWAVKNGIVLQSGKPFNPSKALDKATAIVLLKRLWTAWMKEKGGG